MEQLIHEGTHGRGAPGLCAALHARPLLGAVETDALEVRMGGFLSTEFVIRQDTIFRVGNDGTPIFPIDHGQSRRPESVNIGIGIPLQTTSNRLGEPRRLLR
jgi:hypothetical protein